MKLVYSLLVLLALLMGQASSVSAQKSPSIDSELQQLQAKLTSVKHDTARIMVYVDISMFFQDVQHQSDSALVYALKAKQLANKYPNYPKVPKVWNCLGFVSRKLYETRTDPKVRQFFFEQSEQALKKCIQKAKQFKDEEFFKRARFNNILLYSHLSNKYAFFKSSLEFINYMQQKTQWNGVDTLLAAKIYKRLCIELDYQVGSKRSNEYLAHFRNLISKKEGIDYEEFCLFSMDQHSVLGKKRDEKKILEEYQTYKKMFTSDFRKDLLEDYLAQYYFTIQEYEKSFQIMADFLPRSYDSLVNNNNKKLTILSLKYTRMGQCAYMLNRNQEAICYLNKAVSYIIPIKNIASLENEHYTTLVYLSKAYKKAGNYKEALAFTEKANKLYQQIHDVGIQALMAENDVHLEEIKQEKKIQEARTQTLLREHDVEIQKKQKYVFFAISILTLLSTAWALYSFTKTRKQNRIISQQAAALEESNQMKDKIFALLSHDLRSPINRLVISLNQSIEIQRTSIQSELKGVQDILNNVLYWASMQLKKTSPVPVSVPLQPLAEELMEEYRHALEEKGITFLNNIENDVDIKTDESYLKIILRNLISNAIKFTEAGGYIQIACRSVPRGLEILLKDTGVGIATDKLDSLFQLPVPSVGTNKEKGTGLGLSLSHDIVQKLGGSLNIQSKQGKGTQVVVALPV